MRPLTGAALAALWSAVPAAAEESRRDLAAHEHGRGALAIAVENNAVWMELEAPGADIVGFEHAAESDADKAAVEAAKQALSRPLALFALPEDAGCAVADARVALLREDDAHDDDHDDHADEHDEHADEHDEHADEHDEHDDEHDAHDDEHEDAHDDDHGEEGPQHAEFHAEYRLDCADAGAIDSIGFAYFEAFPGAESLSVTIVSDKGQTALEVARESPALDVAAFF